MAHGVAARSGLNSSPPARPAGEQAVAELADEPQLEQPPELGQGAHRTPQGERRTHVDHGNPVLLHRGAIFGDRCSAAPTHSTNIAGGRGLFATLAGC